MEKTENISINGVKHFFIEYEYEPANPVVLYVHGGPGMSESLIGWEMASATKGICNWVFYDQRGAGRTFYESPEKLVEYDEIFADLTEVVKYVHDKYNKKIYIMAHNWGTIAAARYVRDNPQYVAGYIGYGQVTDMIGTTRIRCDRITELAERSRSRRDVKAVEKIRTLTNGTFDKSLMKKKHLTKLNVLLNKYNIASGRDKNLMKRIPASPLYDLADLRIMMNGPKISFKLSEYMKTVNLFAESMEYEVPVLFISGDWDYQMPCVLVEKYCEEIKAPYKKMALLKDTGSDAMYEAPSEFWDEFADFVAQTEKTES